MSAEAKIAWVERGGDALAIVTGLALRLAAPETSIVTTRPMLLVAAGVVLLAVGLARDLARIALEGRPVATAPDRHPGELRLCLESTLGLGAVVAKITNYSRHLNIDTRGTAYAQCGPSPAGWNG